MSYELSPQLDVVRQLVPFRQPHPKHIGLGLGAVSRLIHVFRSQGSVLVDLFASRWSVNDFVQQSWWAVSSSCTVQDPNRRWCIEFFRWNGCPFDVFFDADCFAAGG